MIRVALTYADHIVDLRVDTDWNPEVMDTLIREAQEALATQILTVAAATA